MTHELLRDFDDGGAGAGIGIGTDHGQSEISSEGTAWRIIARSQTYIRSARFGKSNGVWVFL